jgi:hypothetical protein
MANVDVDSSEEVEQVAFACPRIPEDKDNFDFALQFSL